MSLNFRNWLESKGILLPAELEEKIDAVAPNVLQAALKVKQANEIISVYGASDNDDTYDIQYTSPYFSGQRSTEIRIANDPSDKNDGTYNPLFGVVINVANQPME